MKAIIKNKKELNNREKLENVIPLKTPFSLFVEPSDKCNFKCKFCPTSNIDLMKNTEGRNYGNMDFNLYKKVIDDICEFDDNIKMLHLYQHGEPLLNKYFPEMVRYAKKSGRINRIDTTTNAYLLTNELSIKIIESGLDRINISIEGVNEEQYYQVSNVKINFEKLIENISFFYNNKNRCEVSIKIPGNYISENDKKNFYDVFGNICDFIFVENLSNNWGEFEIKDINIDESISTMGEKIQYVDVCPMIFYTISVNSNGSVSPCCADWKRKVIIGDANNEKIKDIWNGKKLRDLQILFLEGRRKEHSFCSSCYSPIYSMTDNIDRYKIDILKRIDENGGHYVL